MYKVNVEITGIAPLLQHNPGDLTNSYREGMDKKLVAEGNLYRTAEEKIFQPATHIKAGLIRSAVNFQIPGKGHKTYKDIVKAAVLVEPAQIIHKHQKWAMDAQYGVLPSTHGRVLIIRARLDKWALAFSLIVLQEDALPNAKLREILDYMARFNGLGDFRPEYGRFTVSKFEVVGA